MPKQVDKLKKERYKQARLNNKSIKQSLIDAGYTERTAHQSSTNSIVKQCENELLNSIKAKDITIEWVVNQLTKELVAPDAKASDRIRVSELLGKYIKMFNDSNPLQVIVFTDDITKDLPKLKIDSNIDTKQEAIDVSSSNSKG